VHNVSHYHDLCHCSLWFRITMTNLHDDMTTYNDKLTRLDRAVSDLRASLH
jgi:hypothetical protein